MPYDKICVGSHVDTEVSVTYNHNTHESNWTITPEHNATLVHDLLTELVSMGESRSLTLSSECNEVEYNIGSLSENIQVMYYDQHDVKLQLSIAAHVLGVFVINGTYIFHNVRVRREDENSNNVGYVSFDRVSVNFDSASISLLL